MDKEKITTEYHKYFVGLSYDPEKEDEDVRKIVKLDVSDTDELAIIIDDEPTVWISLGQLRNFMILENI